MYIRQAKQSEFKDIQKIIEIGRLRQNAEGNYHQWTENYPSHESILSDILAKKCYVCVSKNLKTEKKQPIEILATFVLNTEREQSYEQINGSWQGNDSNYVVIHRLASSGLVKGMGSYCINWVLERYSDVRLDTHPDNVSMIALMRSLDFTYCGIVIAQDGNERMAFQKIS